MVFKLWLSGRCLDFSRRAIDMGTLIVLLAVLSQAPGAKASEAYHPKAGDKAFLVPQVFDPGYLSVPVIEPVEASFREFMKASASPDDEAVLSKMLADRKIALVKVGTAIEVTRPINDMVEGSFYAVSIKILEGPLKGANACAGHGWISKSLPTVNGMSFRRFLELKATAERSVAVREAREARSKAAHARSKAEADAMIAAVAQRQAIQAAQEAEYIRQNSPDYVSVTRDKTGRVSSIYTHMPNGMSSFRSSSGYNSTTQTFSRP